MMWAKALVLVALSLAAPRARQKVVEQHLNDWNTTEARKELQALKAEPDGNDDLTTILEARIEFEEGRYEEAIAHLTQAGADDGPGHLLKLYKDTARTVGQHLKFDGQHFDVYVPKGKDELLVPYALEALEAQRTALEKDLGFVPDHKVRIEFVSTATELSRVSTLSGAQIRTTGTIAVCKFSKLMVTSPKATPRGYDWLDTLAHEYTHLVISEKSHNTVPIWMHEGLAKYLETRWRGPAGKALSPSTLSLLGMRVQKKQLISFEKMHPSIAMLPRAEDAATAYAEVFFAIDWIRTLGGETALKDMLGAMARGVSEKKAVELVTRKTWPEFEAGWMAHIKRQPFPQELIPQDIDERHELSESKSDKADKKAQKKKGREVTWGDFAEVKNTEARKAAHLGELMRERERPKAAAEFFGRAHSLVKDTYESVSSKYALALMESGQDALAEPVLEGSLAMHPGSASSHIYLGRIALKQRNFKKARRAYLEAVATNPFDEEVHLALFRVHQALGEAALADREKRAVAVLLKIPETDVPELARKYAPDSPQENPPDGGGPSPSLVP